MRARDIVIQACGYMCCGCGIVAALYAMFVLGSAAIVPGLILLASGVWAMVRRRHGATVLLCVASPCLVLGVVLVPDFVAERYVAIARWLCVGLFGPSIIGAILLRLHPEKERTPDGLCPACGYPIEGLRSPRCPECGRNLTNPP